MLAGILIRLAAFVAIAINPSSLFDLNGAYAPSNIHDGIEGIAINSSSAAELKGSYATPEIHDDVKDVYDAAIEKGNSLLCLFTSIATPRPGAFQNWDQLQQYGWKVIESRALDSPGDVSSMLDALGLSKNQGVNYWLGIQHTGDFKNKDGVTGKGTNGHYVLDINTIDGLLINEVLKSPKFALNDPQDNSPTRPSDPTPDLQRRSDLTWLMWAKRSADTGRPPSGLRYVLDHVVTTEATQTIVKRILGDKGRVVAPWPGYKVDKLRSAEFKAMVGSPHGFGLAFFLADHRKDIRKKIRAITLFSTMGGGKLRYQLLWELSDIPPGNKAADGEDDDCECGVK